MLFSERIGKKIKPVDIQIDSMTNDLRNRLWNVFDTHIVQYDSSRDTGWRTDRRSDLDRFFIRVWNNLFKLPLDNRADNIAVDVRYVRNYFFNCEWYEVYDFLEFCCKNFPGDGIIDDFKRVCNEFLEEELSAYRFVSDEIVRVTNAEEINTLENAIKADSVTYGKHISRALELWGDRNAPDYRNSIKESISAVESIIKIHTGCNSLRKGLNKLELEFNFELNNQLKDGVEKLWNYTNSEKGVRHYLMLDSKEIPSEDAYFMLVTCSALVNYILKKIGK